MKTQNINNKLVFGKHSISELNDFEISLIFGGTTLIIETENPIKSISGFEQPNQQTLSV